jgi:hypothetical protein
MDQSQIPIAEMNDADGIHISIKARVEHGVGNKKHIFIRSIRAISKRDDAELDGAVAYGGV